MGKLSENFWYLLRLYLNQMFNSCLTNFIISRITFSSHIPYILCIWLIAFFVILAMPQIIISPNTIISIFWILNFWISEIKKLKEKVFFYATPLMLHKMSINMSCNMAFQIWNIMFIFYFKVGVGNNGFGFGPMVFA